MNLVEFTGLPGAGKSTVLPLIKTAYLNKNISTSDTSDIYVKVFSELAFGKIIIGLLPTTLLKKKVAARWVRQDKVRFKGQVEAIKQHQYLTSVALKINAIRAISQEESSNIVSWFFSTISIYTLAQKVLPDEDSLLLDEGFFHKILNLFASADEFCTDESVIKQYLDLMPKIDTLVYVETSVSSCIQRISRRKSTYRYGWLDDEKFEALLVHMKWLIDISVDHVEKKGTKVVRISNEIAFENEDNMIDRIMHSL